jgi:hypothetical protein
MTALLVKEGQRFAWFLSSVPKLAKQPWKDLQLLPIYLTLVTLNEVKDLRLALLAGPSLR